MLNILAVSQQNACQRSVSSIISSNMKKDTVLQMSPRSGFVSSQATGCVLTLTGPPGQRWNITMLDFGYASLLSAQKPAAGGGGGGAGRGIASSDSSSMFCRKYATIKAEGETPLVVCGSNTRHKTIHVSTGSHLTIVLTYLEQTSPQFLIRFEG